VGVMVISQCQKTPGTCGLAADIGAKPETAFCIVLLECMNNNLSFPHEIGHLMGARHNWEADATGKTEHGAWFKGKDKKNHWRTIMCYPCPGGTCTRLPFWSNPETKIKGISTGSPVCCNNTAMLNANAARISQFR
jgi:peptidyl-Asp metalloendopeptidase